MLCVGGCMVLYQQARIIKPLGLSSWLEIHKTHKWWSNQMGTEQSWVYIDMNGKL